MVVRDEAHQLAECLSSLVDLFDQIVVIDTGSRDGTPQLMLERFGIEVLHRDLDEDRCGCLCDSRHHGLSQLSTPWVLLLDADERLERDALERILALPDDPMVSGYFGRWLNRAAGEADFEDYKLFLFRSGLRPVGLVHDVVQIDVRSRGLHADWLDDLDVLHLPDARRRQTKVDRYRQRLRCAMKLQPDFYRYDWFLGYMEFRAGHWERSAELLSRLTEACSPQFPVECLNSSMVLAEMLARQQDRPALERILSRACAFYQDVSEDFEVRINVRLGPWLEAALGHLHDGRIDRIRAYRFAC